MIDAPLDNSTVPNYRSMIDLSQRNYIVLGAGNGMGRQTSHALAAMGAKVLCVDIDKPRAKAVANEVDGAYWVGDVTSKADIEGLISFAQTLFTRIDGVVDIVGMAAWREVADMDDELWNQQFDINLRHAYLISQAITPLFRESGGGVMVFIASVSGVAGASSHAAYGAAKAGLISLVRSLAVELGGDGIRVNAVAPGSIMTPRIKLMMADNPAMQQSNRDNVPLNHQGLPQDIASTVLFLCSDLSAYISGQTLVVDGAVTAKFPFPLS